MRLITGSFDPTRAPIADADLVADYLAQAHPVMLAPAVTPDELDPSRRVCGVGVVTDGVLLWSASCVYYVREHGVAPPADLLAHVREQGYRFPEVSPAALAEAVAAVRPGPRQRSSGLDPFAPRS